MISSKKIVNTVLVFSITFAVVQSFPVAASDSVEKCEQDGYQNCYYGIPWGEKVNDERLAVICRETKDYSFISDQDLYLRIWDGKLPENDQKICYAKKPVSLGQPLDLEKKVRYLARKFLENQRTSLRTKENLLFVFPPVYEALLSMLNRNANIKPEEWAGLNIEMLWPVKLGNAKRYLVTLGGKAIGYATNSVVAKDVDPVFFFLEAKKKYGPPLVDYPKDQALKEWGAEKVALWLQPSALPPKLIGIVEDPKAKKMPAGFRASQIVSGSAAEKAELKAGDIIISVDGKPVNSAADIRPIISDKNKVAVKFNRGGQQGSVVVTPATNPQHSKSDLVRMLFARKGDEESVVQTVVFHWPTVKAEVDRLWQETKAESEVKQNNTEKAKGENLNNVDF